MIHCEQAIHLKVNENREFWAASGPKAVSELIETRHLQSE